MKVVLDTNVVVSGLLSPFNTPGEIIRMVASGALELYYDARILSEYRSILLCQKFSFDRTHVENLLEQIETCGYLTTGKPLAERLPDPDDEPFLEMALRGEAQYLVTGNMRHYPAKKQQGMQIVSPREFLEIYRKKK